MSRQNPRADLRVHLVIASPRAARRARMAAPAEHAASYPAKRMLDVLGALAACVLLAPLIAVTALAKWLEDGHSPVFLQVRIGARRRPFTVIKLRTMQDQRVTSLGAWLRRTGIDEVPQFINVLKGDMSIVGPRPLTARDIERLGWNEPELDWRFEAKPGITGLSQLMAGHSARLSRRLDRAYLRRPGLLRDLNLIAVTAAVGALGKRRVRGWLSKGRRA